MKEIRGENYVGLYDRNTRQTFHGIHFINCAFLSCAFSITNDPDMRSRAVDMRFTKCSVQGSSLRGGILDDVIIDGLKTIGLFQGWAMALRHVVLTGRIGRVMLSSTVAPGVDGFAPSPIQHAFDQANREFYSQVDWALDISNAEFREIDLRGIPARLIRRDPSTQVVVRREKALSGTWRHLDLENTYWPTFLELMLEREDDDVVLVAPKGSKDYQRLLVGLEVLRSAGVAEPD